MDAFKNAPCCVCGEQFSITEFHFLKGKKTPYLASCGHAVCTTCKTGSKLCKICPNPSAIDLPGSIHAPLLGHLLLSVQRHSPLRAQKSLDENIKTCHECNRAAEFNCAKCEVFLCLACWHEVHQLKTLKTHQKVSIEDMDDGLGTCDLHENSPRIMYCKDCDFYCCYVCVFLNHQGHSSLHLDPSNCLQLNSDLKDRLTESIDEAGNTLQRMKHSLMMINSMSTKKGSKNVSDVQLEVVNVFTQIHGLVQKAQESILTQLADSDTNSSSLLSNFQVTLKKQIKELSAVLKKSQKGADSSLEKLSGFHFPYLIKQLKTMSSLPSCILKNEEEAKQISLTIDDQIVDKLSKLVVLEGASSPFKLLAVSELPDNYELPPITPSDSLVAGLISNAASREDSEDSTTSSVLGKNGMLKVDSSSASAKVDRPVVKKKSASSRKNNGISQDKKIKVNESVHDFIDRRRSVDSESVYEYRDDMSDVSEASRYSELGGNSVIAVTVAYVKDPGEFYVHFSQEILKLQALERHIASKAEGCSGLKAAVKGEMVLARYHKLWYRASVLNLKGNNLTVHYIDYGNSGVVKMTEVRLIPNILKRTPPFAFKCRLGSCESIGGIWQPDATAAFTKLVKSANNKVTLYVEKEKQGYLDVDVACSFEDGTGKFAVSIRDYMLWLNHATLLHGRNKTPVPITVPEYERRNFMKGVIHPVKAGHVISPSLFFVQLLDGNDEYQVKCMEKKLTKFYSEKHSQGILHYPIEGMPCAVLDEQKDIWVRGKFLIMSSTVEMRVVMVDYGKVVDIKDNNVRRIHSDFLALPPLVVKVGLLDVHPPNKFTGWTPDARAVFKKLLLNKQLEMTVVEVEDDYLKVVLTDVGKNNLCLNTEVMKLGLALPISDQEKDWLDNQSRSITTRPFNKKGKKPKVKKRPFPQVPIPPLVPQERHIPRRYSSSSDSDSDDKEKVSIIKIESPNEIYIKNAKGGPLEKELEAALAETYVGTLPDETETTWKVGDWCAFRGNKSVWYRGVIEEMEEDEVKVFSPDHGFYYDVNHSNLRALTPALRGVKVTFKCHLDGIVPSGAEWSSIATDTLQEFCKDAQGVGYILITGDADDSVPVELFIKRYITQGILEPFKPELVSMNRHLVSKCLALAAQDSGMMWKSAPSKKKEVATVKIDDKPNSNTSEKSQEEADKPTADPEIKLIAPSLSVDWFPPEPITEDVIEATITYVDERGVLYFTKDADGEKLQEIKNELNIAYENSRPTNFDSFWTKGQLCAVRFHVDMQWYRGKIIEVGPDRTYLVLFVDYGNLELCQVNDLRKRCTTESPYPSFCHSCYPSNYVPAKGNVLSLDGIKLLHSIAVEMKCTIKVVGSNQGEPFAAQVNIGDSGSQWMAPLVETEVFRAHRKLSRKLPPRDLSGKELWENGTTTAEPSVKLAQPVLWHGRKLTIPPTVTCLPVTISAISPENIHISLQPDTSYPDVFEDIVTEFASLISEIEEQYQDLCSLEKVLPGIICIAPFQDNYYRALVVSVDTEKQTARVRYIDYGNLETVGLSSLLECKEEWITLPEMSLCIKLNGIEPDQDSNWMEKLLAISECGSVYAQIVDRCDDYLAVDLLTNPGGPLIYEELIKTGLFKKVKGSDESGDEVFFIPEGSVTLKDGSQDATELVDGSKLSSDDEDL